MTPENQKKYEEKYNRIYSQVAHKETDRLPIDVDGGIYAVTQAGFTCKDVIYDTTLEKQKIAIDQYHEKYDPDFACGMIGYAGEGPMMEIAAPTFMAWSGRPGYGIQDNSLQQFLENPPLKDEDIDMFFDDNWHWRANKCLPNNFKLYDAMKDFTIPYSSRTPYAFAEELSKPAVREMIEKSWKLTDMRKEFMPKMAALQKHIAESGYVKTFGGKICVPYDEWGDEYRGTLDSTTDLYENRDAIDRFIGPVMEQMLDKIKNLNKDHKNDNKTVLFTLHKGQDGFLSKDIFEEYYWKPLQQLIYAIVDVGMIPNVFLESNYSTRLDYLKEVPKDRVIYQLEYTPLDQAKKVLGDVACLTRGFRQPLLTYGTKEQVVDEVKKTIDLMAPGGGYIFGTSCSLDFCKPELVEAMFDTLHTYGKK